MHKAGIGHVGGDLSVSDILSVLFGDVLQIDPREPFSQDRDRFIMSKGHAAASLYSAMALVGFFAEVGMAHFPKKRAKISLWLKTVLVSYYDWGIGFKYLGGSEKTTINYYDALGNLSLTETGKG